MIKLNVGCKYELEFVDKVIELNEKYESLGARVNEVYGTHPYFRGVISDVREGFRNLGTGLEEFKQAVAKLRKAKIDVNYVMNSPVLGECYIAKYKVKILNTVKRLKKIGVNIITTPDIELTELIKKHIPNLKVYFSTVADTKNQAELDYAKEIGFDRVIPGLYSNRDFAFLKYAKKICQPLELLLQSTCRFNCLRRKNHAISEALMEKKPNDPEVRDYFVRSCFIEFNRDFPAGFLKTSWIMPEDLKKCDKLCGDVLFKVNGRTLTIDERLFITECYLRGKSPHNFGNLFAATTAVSNLEGNKYRKIFLPSALLLQKVTYKGKKYNGFTDYFFKENLTYEEYDKYCRHFGKLIKNKVSLGKKTEFYKESGIEKYPSLKKLR